jgi:MFS family permease
VSARHAAGALPRTVVVLGLVSLVNDAASEMITPLLPLFLTATLGAGPAIVGLVEGVAEATASILKVVSGRLADRGLGAKRLVFAGYGASGLARPAIGLALGWGAVLLLRFLDRVGKGLRTAPRDALIAAAVPAGRLGKAFGFHRAMDHAGAVVGPLLAFALLSAGADLGEVFLWSILPGLAVLALIAFGLPADAPVALSPAPRLEFRSLHPRLKALLVAAGLMALAALPEAFMVLWAVQAGIDLALIPLVWAVASAVKMAVVFPAGQLSDRLGRLPVLVGGWGARVAVLLVLAFTQVTGPWAWVLFVAYAACLAVNEAPERSLVGDVAPQGLRGTAYGVYHFITGLLALPGALLLGWVWQVAGPAAAFVLAAVLTAVAAVAMLALALRMPGRGPGRA